MRYITYKKYGNKGEKDQKKALNILSAFLADKSKVNFDIC